MTESPAPRATADLEGNGPAADVVIEFLTGLEALDADRVLGRTADGIVYQNVSLPAIRGARAFERAMRTFGKVATGFEARVHRIAANGPVVLTERTDVIEIGAWRAEFWVCGVFEVREGRIELWRDYFDWGAFLLACARATVGAVGSALRRP